MGGKAIDRAIAATMTMEYSFGRSGLGSHRFTAPVWRHRGGGTDFSAPPSGSVHMLG
jgi:hypothetical protein